MRHTFSLFQSHLDLAHFYWSRLIQIGDTVIDATCGNGHDTKELALLTLSEEKGLVYGFDIQKAAIQSSHQLLSSHFSPTMMQRIQLQQSCHSRFPHTIAANSVQLIVYNLGYLPGGDKDQTTLTATTLESIKQAQDLIKPGGSISITCYPGHSEGAHEEEVLLHYLSTLSPKQWSCCTHRWLNRQKAPLLILVQKSKNF